MLRRAITYKNLFTDDEVTETFYFNLTPREIIELEASYEGGIGAYYEKVQKTESRKEALDFFQNLVLKAYGYRPPENDKRFIKNNDVRDEFIEIGAWDALWFELLTDEKAQLDFFLAIIPEDMRQQIAKSIQEADGDISKAVAVAQAPRPPAPVPPAS